MVFLQLKYNSDVPALLPSKKLNNILRGGVRQWRQTPGPRPVPRLCPAQKRNNAAVEVPRWLSLQKIAKRFIM